MSKPVLDNGLTKKMPKKISKKEYDRLVELQMTPKVEKRRSDGKVPTRVFPETPTPPTIRYTDENTQEIRKSIVRNLAEEFDPEEKQSIEKLVDLKRPDEIAQDFRVSLKTACNHLQSVMNELNQMFDSFDELYCNKK